MFATARLSLFTAVLWLLPVAASAQKGCNPDDLFCEDPSVDITPDGAADGSWHYTTANAIVFTVRNIGLGGTSIELACTTGGKASNCHLSDTVVSLGSGQSTNVTAWYDAGAPGSGIVVLTGSPGGPGAGDQGSYSVSVSPGPPPNISVTNYEPRRLDYGMCLNACFTATYAQATVPYFSLDTPRSVALVYNEDRTSNRPFVYAEVTQDNPSNPPTAYQLRVKINGAYRTFVNGENVLTFSYPGATLHRLGGQFDASDLASGAYLMYVEVSSVFPSGSATSLAIRHLVVLDERNSAVARGWSIGGLQRVYLNAGGVLIAEGDGSYTHFLQSYGVWSPPDGDFTRLTDTGPANAKWVRHYPDSTTATFNDAGRLVEVRDVFDNVTAFGYDGYGRLSTITDPVSLTTTLTYDANGLSTITDPQGRITDVTVQANGTLTAITDPDNKSTMFAYDGALRLTDITDRLGKTTTLSYEAQSGKLASIKLPSLTIEGMGTQRPTTLFDPFQKDGVPYAATTSMPFPPVLAGTIDATVTAPSGIVTGYRNVNKHGQAVHALLPSGVDIVTSYNARGQPIGVVDPTAGNATYSYDGTGFLTYASAGGREIWRRNGGWGRADSVWTANTHTRYYLNAQDGRVDSVRVGNAPAVTRYGYGLIFLGRGRVTSITDPAGHVSHLFWYYGENGNLSNDIRPGDRLTYYAYDAYGRDTSVSTTGLPTRRTTYDILNRPRNHYDGVNPTPTVMGYDALHLRSVTDPAGQVYSYTYRTTGWPRKRIDPTGAFEETHYGLNGEIARVVNRRGQNIRFAYDSLLRVTDRWGDNLDSVTFAYDGPGQVVVGSSLDRDTVWSVDSVFQAATTGLLDSLVTRFPKHGEPDPVWWTPQ